MTNHDFLISKLKTLNFSNTKQQEIIKNKHHTEILTILFTNFTPNKLHYTLASKIPKTLSNNKENLILIGSLIQKNVIKHEKSILAAFEYLLRDNKNDSLECFIVSFEKTKEEIFSVIDLQTAKNDSLLSQVWNKKELSKLLVHDESLKFTNPALINECIDAYLIKTKDIKEYAKSQALLIPDEFKWLKAGEMSMIHTPQTNPNNTLEVLNKHLKRTGGKVITRFPPEPNGFLHIGHAKALNLSYDFAKMCGGEFILRFDDTNPKNEKDEFYKSIQDDIDWLFKTEGVNNNANMQVNKVDSMHEINNINITGINNKTHSYDRVTYASDYFEKFIQFGFVLIEKAKAYICHQTQEEIKASREANIESPFRNRSITANRILFQEMIDGMWSPSTISLRLRMDMSSKNPLMHDLVAFRVINHAHFRTGNKFKVYPSYDFTHCINDSLEDVTHSFCSREFFNRRATYYWLLDELNLYKPVQWEFSRLKIEDTLLSKRNIIDLIERGVVSGWDDPRLYTLRALRRRGFTPDGINNFVKSLGVTFNDTTIEVKALENFIRIDLIKNAIMMNCVVEPLRMVINKIDGSVEEIFIERSDFSPLQSEGFYRLAPGQPVGLINFIVVEYLKHGVDFVQVNECNKKPMKYIHHVKDCVEVTLRLYDRLFKNGELNQKSLVVKKGLCDKEIRSMKIYEVLQFRRVGFFCVDVESAGDDIFMNLTLPLKNATWSQ